MKACLIGKVLKHSFSKEIHQALGTEYHLQEVAADNLAQFVNSKQYRYYNVTIPYKQDIISLLQRLDSSATEVGSVNTVVCQNGELVGYNTDIDGMEFMFRRAGVSPKGKNVVVLGTGGTCKTACAFLARHNAAKVTIVGRTQQWNYQNYHLLADTQILINTTPVGMFPNCGESLVDINCFPALEFVADVIYNPLKTQLLLQAEQRKIPCANGLSMLVYQAVRAEEIWQNKSFEGVAEGVLAQTRDKFQNVVLVGMPSCGKSTVGKILAQKLGKNFVDLDEEIEKSAQSTVADILTQRGENYFRDLEQQVVGDFGKMCGLVIATGGGAPLRKENRDALQQNGFVVWLQRDLHLLSTCNRPLSQQKGVEQIFAERQHIYNEMAQITVQNNGAATQAAKEIENAYKEYIGNKRS